MVHAQSATIDTIMKGASDDTARLILYLQQRIELEEGYQNSLAKIVHHLEENETTNPLYQSAVNTHIQKNITDYINMGHALRPSRHQFIQTMKIQLQTLVKLKEQHDRSRRSHRKNMHQVNSLYLATRLDELPTARDTYLSKWEEIERHQSPIPYSPSPFTPTTPTQTNNNVVSPRTQFFPKSIALSKSSTISNNNHDETSSSSSSSSTGHRLSGDDDVSSLPINQAVAQTKLDSSPPPPSPQKRIHQFMKSFQINHVPDPAKQNLRLAKLKVEMNEADLTYRRIIRKLDNLTKKQQAANDYAIKALQTQLLEKSNVVKQAMNEILMVELNHAQYGSETIQAMQQSITSFQPQLDQHVFDHLLSKDKYPMPSPIYYINHHVGECKDLIFGITLMEYTQLRGRSPPLVVSRCIEAVERLGGLEKEGIYRVSGKQTTIERMKQEFERDEEAMTFGDNEEVFCIASVLKIFLRELASPLFPFALPDRITYSQIPDKELRLMNLLTRILKLPGPNYDTLKALVEHLSKLEPLVEKNKMTISNLSLIFTPAIFQDHNQVQVSPNEWKKDCVLEDLLVNGETLFADKDLRGASAITGVIDYGFEKLSSDDDPTNDTIIMLDDAEGLDMLGEKDEYHLPTPYSPPAYTTYMQQQQGENDIIISSEKSTTKDITVPPMSSSLPYTTNDQTNSSPSTPLPSNASDIVPELSTSTLLSGKEKRNSKFRAVSQDRGLTVDTNHTSIKKSSNVLIIEGSNLVAEPDDSLPITTSAATNAATAVVVSTDNAFLSRPPMTPSIQSATVPSHDWLNYDPEPSHKMTDTTAALRRSATTGRTPLSKRNKQNTVPRLPTKPSTSSTTHQQHSL
ncbi:uncharacterized protein BX664DRAFT_342035 [Halteromyces radiatus]|uniref:uncharacterized protein n=1 Tax=Halteromyces radiatus TaxID=101107 RepID=UPI002220C3CB|nr:uncharacterized protein BX664DRAFT_342035 [Halteromyces radiatus]KAI8080000.1 hypothetical protein BX664DRAFT_342035 [Halteromyces radiatus]